MPSVSDVIAGYIQLRDAKDALRRKQQEEMRPLNEKLDKLGNWLLKELNESGGDSITSRGVGTAFTSTRTSQRVADWDKTLPFIREHELWHMLDRRISKTAVEEFIQATGEPPPGVEIVRETVINVRKVQEKK